MTDGPKTTPLRTFTAQNGRTFTVRVLPPGARYGTGTVYADAPMVEFYDATYADDSLPGGPPGFGPWGQFVSRYHGATLLEGTPEDAARRGLCLDGGVPQWTIDRVTMVKVRGWLASMLPTCTKSFVPPGDPHDSPWVCTRHDQHYGVCAVFDGHGRLVAIEGQPMKPGGGYDLAPLHERWTPKLGG